MREVCVTSVLRAGMAAPVGVSVRLARGQTIVFVIVDNLILVSHAERVHGVLAGLNLLLIAARSNVSLDGAAGVDRRSATGDSRWKA